MTRNSPTRDEASADDQPNQPEGLYYHSHIDQHVGSVLERFISRDTGDWCRFCATTRVDEGDFCSEDCEISFEQVVEARVAIGKRDLEQRGYD